jgi:hypothetical protein
MRGFSLTIVGVGHHWEACCWSAPILTFFRALGEFEGEKGVHHLMDPESEVTIYFEASTV